MKSALEVLMTICAATLMLGCHGQDLPASDELAGERFEVRLQGTKAQSYSALYATLKWVGVTAGGQPVPVQLQPASQAMDLTNTAGAYLAAYFWLPPGTTATTADITAAFDDYGAYQAADSSAGAVDARGQTVKFTAPVDQLRLRHHAVIQLDASQSLTPPKRGGRQLLPNAMILY